MRDRRQVLNGILWKLFLYRCGALRPGLVALLQHPAELEHLSRNPETIRGLNSLPVLL